MQLYTKMQRNLESLGRMTPIWDGVIPFLAILKIGSLTSLLVNLSGDKVELIGKFLATFCFVLIFDLSIVKKLCSAHARGSVCKVWIELRVNLSKIQLVIILKLVGPLHSFFVL